MIREGQHFTFFDASAGRRDDYVVQTAEGENGDEQYPSSLVHLRNLRTQGVACVTVKWLTDGYSAGRMHWLPTEQVPA